LKLKVCIASSSLVSQAAIEAFNRSSEVDLVCIISNPDKPTGRGQAFTANPLAQWASSSGLTVHKPQTDEEIAKILIENSIDLLITIAYGHILSAFVLEIPSYGCLNLHFSLLPKYRGAAPVQWALLNGDIKTGVTVFKLEAGMDTGPIFVQKEFPISEHDTTQLLLDKLTPIGVESLQESVAMLCNGQKPEPQDSASSSQAPKIMKDEGRINWQMSAATIYNQYRAIGENPGLFTELSGNRIRINEIAIDKDQRYPVGGINLMGNKLVVGTSDFAIEIKSLTPQGRKPMSGIDFYNGLRDKSGLKFA
jgi:methionyl-tRNA formyltransferase